MSRQTNERAFESHVEEVLLQGGWKPGTNAEWDVERALFPARVCAFLEATQPKLWAEMRTLHADSLEKLVINALVKELDVKGALHVLRHGFKFYGKTFRLAYFKPAHGLNDEVLALYTQNQLTLTRQVLCHPGKHDTVDLLFTVNGLPVATCELKNPGTGQSWRNAIAQYQKDRDPRAPLFAFKTRALVHFAADPDEVYMATRLLGAGTHFLPFNRGSHPGEVQCGAGNPQHPSGYRTGYFWENVLQRDGFLEILGQFMFVEKKEEKVDGKAGPRQITRETVIFPRYHQLDAVRKILASAREEGSGRNYLIQHSAGSGKTNSISWLSHHLASLHDAEDQKVFDCVVVITDRRVLDQQLQDAIYQIEHAQGVVKAIDQDSQQLATALIDGTRIVITTLQKFPFVLRALLRVAGAETQEKATAEEKAKAKSWETQIAKRRYAVIVDEAHSSQTGETARELKSILGSGASEESDDEGETDWEDRLNRVMASRGKQPNLSFFAFTATPKGKTLELFGRPGSSGKPEAFHIYSMRQAIEEGFILDVLANYTTYDTYYKLLKAAEDDPNLPKKKAARALTKFVTLHPYNIEQKTEVIVEHFRRSVLHRLNGRAKAMVVTSSRLHAVRYKLAFERYLTEKLYTNIRALVAFSGTVRDPETGHEYTEPGMNRNILTGRSISEAELPARFESDYQVLLVANKYQTGFDQPLLCAMYVDKRLDGVQAVQTLSRLNRKILGKDPPFVLDFVNEAQNIYLAFKPYYDKTELSEASDPSMLDALKHDLDRAQVYHDSEIEAFAQVFYKPIEKQGPSDHAHMQRHLQPAVDRFKAITEESMREEFRDKLSAYVKVYAFLSQIVPYADPDLERLYSFGRFLLPHLPLNRDTTVVKVGDEVSLQYYRLERVYSGAIDLKEGETQRIKSPSEVGTGKARDEKAPLSEIIQVLNERFGTQFTEEDRLFFQQIKERACRSEQIIKTALANPLDKFELGIRKLIESLMMERMGENDKIVTRYMADQDFQSSAFLILAREIFETVRERAEFSNAGTENAN
jgi:type I restriction enzyme R subunit